MPKAKIQKTPRKASALTEKQEKFALGVASGLTVKDSMAAAGMQPHDGTGNALTKHPGVQDLMKAEQRKNAYMLGLTREDVLKGMMEAVEDAKIMSDPMSQIAGWREIAKICGFYAPEVKKIEISGKGKALIDRMATMTDEELLQMAEGEPIDVEFTEVKH